MNYKKLLATAVFTLGAWMSAGVAKADPTLTYYNFNFAAAQGGSIVGKFGVDTTDIIQSIEGEVSNIMVYGTAYTGPITALIGPSGNGYSIDFLNFNLYDPSIPTPDFAFSAAGTNFWLTPFSGPYALFQAASDYSQRNFVDNGVITFPSSTGVVPEMNASLIPQVGLLLGCLFLLFGRKKEFTEPMLAA